MNKSINERPQQAPDGDFGSHGLRWELIIDSDGFKVWNNEDTGACFSFNGHTREWRAGYEHFGEWSEARDFAVRCSKRSRCSNCSHFEADVEFGAMAGLCTRSSEPTFAVHYEFCSNWNLRK